MVGEARFQRVLRAPPGSPAHHEPPFTRFVFAANAVKRFSSGESR